MELSGKTSQKGKVVPVVVPQLVQLPAVTQRTRQRTIQKTKPLSFPTLPSMPSLIPFEPGKPRARVKPRKKKKKKKPRYRKGRYVGEIRLFKVREKPWY